MQNVHSNQILCLSTQWTTAGKPMTSTRIFICTGRQIPRTIFCACGAGLSCLNKLIIAKAIDDNEEDADNAEEDS